jgi:hypothetical protein
MNLLTYLTFELNSLVDRGFSMPIDEAKLFCERGKVLEELQKKFIFKQTSFDLSLLLEEKYDYIVEAKNEINSKFADMTGINERKKYGVLKNGLCLLIAYAQVLIQQEASDFIDFYIQKS